MTCLDKAVPGPINAVPDLRVSSSIRRKSYFSVLEESVAKGKKKEIRTYVEERLKTQALLTVLQPKKIYKDSGSHSREICCLAPSMMVLHRQEHIKNCVS